MQNIDLINILHRNQNQYKNLNYQMDLMDMNSLVVQKNLIFYNDLIDIIVFLVNYTYFYLL